MKRSHLGKYAWCALKMRLTESRRLSLDKPYRNGNAGSSSAGLAAAPIHHLIRRMSCRTAVNMTKRAAAGAMSVSVWVEEDIVSSFHPALPAVSRSDKRQVLGYGRASRTLIAFSIFATLSLVSYATYAHQWSELSALRHLGKTSPQ